MNNTHDIVPTHLAVQAMRDNGYKNAAYAIAELMDNAIQAGASQVELLCGERKQQVEGRKRSRIEQIAVLDNGRGMDANVLRLALQFGNGTYLDEKLPKEERKQVIKETLKEEGITETKAELLAATTVDDGLKYTFVEAPLDTPAFFSVKPRGGAIIVTLNTNHPAYQNLVEILEEDVDKADIDSLRSRLVNSLDGLKLLLMAWARYEDEQPDGKRKDNAQDTRIDWGRVARRFLEND
jgi:Histidine kinase-, DNA gyrase B-, and HSP90-like ATPase